MLLQDIDVSDTENWPGGFQPIGNYTGDDFWEATKNPFTGRFNGAGLNIAELCINRPSTMLIGLFGATSNNILNVGLINVNITGKFLYNSRFFTAVSYLFKKR